MPGHHGGFGGYHGGHGGHHGGFGGHHGGHGGRHGGFGRNGIFRFWDFHHGTPTRATGNGCAFGCLGYICIFLLISGLIFAILAEIFSFV